MNDYLCAGAQRILVDRGEDYMKLQLSADKRQRVQWIESLVAPDGWDVMCTFTFRWSASAASAQRVFTRWINRKLPQLSYFYAIEPNPSHDGNHVHSLWSDARGVYRREVWADAFQRWGRARVEPVRSKRDSSDYASKYLCKPNAWYDIKLQWHRLQKLHDVNFKLRAEVAA